MLFHMLLILNVHIERLTWRRAANIKSISFCLKIKIKKSFCDYQEKKDDGSLKKKIQIMRLSRGYDII